MKLALSGYGKMGKAIATIASEHGHQIIATIDTNSDWNDYHVIISQADVVIDFSTPSSAVANIRRCFGLKIPVVCGTTGWDNDLEIIKDECNASGNTLFTAPNFSIGVNIFFFLNRYLAGMMNALTEYDSEVKEIHHIHKLDAPSGTAKLLANDLVRIIDRKRKWVNHTTSVEEELAVISERTGEVPGTHIIRYFSDIDEIEITHTARSRFGFAGGALLAAEWVHGRKGFFTMTDLMHDRFEITKITKQSLL